MGWKVSVLPFRMYSDQLTYFHFRKTIAIIDDEERIVAVLVGRPMVKPGMPDDWPEVVAGFEAAINKLQQNCTLRAKDKVHRRGPHPAMAFGISHGGGQTVCANLILRPCVC